MNKPKVRENIKNVIEIVDSVLQGESTINKKTSDSDYQKHNYTPEALLASIKDSAENAMKGLDEYE